MNPPTGGLSVTFTATVVPQYSGTRTGTVTFMNGATLSSSTPNCGAPVRVRGVIRNRLVYLYGVEFLIDPVGNKLLA